LCDGPLDLRTDAADHQNRPLAMGAGFEFSNNENYVGGTMAKIRGGCLCGSVRYTSDAEPAAVVVCHCVTCQKNTGSAFSLNIGVLSDAVKITGTTLARYEDLTGASGKPFYRSFCSRCGSPIAANGEAYSGMTFIKAGTLDDPSWVTPSAHLWCSEKQPWVAIEHGATQLPKSFS